MATVADVHLVQRLCFNSLFFQWKNLENEEDDEGRGEIKKMSQKTSSNFDRCLTWRFGCCCGRKIRRCQGHHSSTSVHRCTIITFFFIGDGDRKGNLGTKKWVGSKYMKTILFSILKSGYHIS